MNYLRCLLGFLLFSGPLWAMQIPDDNYYAEDNISSLKDRGVRLHAPCRIIIDENDTENPEYKGLQALTQGLDTSLRVAFFPIIVSSSVFYNLMYRAIHRDDQDHTENKNLNAARIKLKAGSWLAYEIPDSQLILLVPHYFISVYGNNGGLILQNLQDISNLLKDQDALLQFLANAQKKPKFSVSQLEKVFQTKKFKPSGGMITKKDGQAKQEQQEPIMGEDEEANKNLPIWDCEIQGHGALESVAGLSHQVIQEVLSFFNSKIYTGILFISSCYAGGKNLDLLQFKSIKTGKGTIERYLQTLNYILIVEAVTDAPTLFRGIEELLYTLFDKAARVSDRSESLNTLLKTINIIDVNSGNIQASIHGVLNTPQVWLPGGLGFQTFNIDERIKVIGPVLVRVHRENKRDIIVNNTVSAVLIYPSIISVGINIAGPQKIAQEMRPWILPTVAELDRSILSGLFMFHSSQFPAHAVIDTTQVNDDYLYPQFISMNHDDNIHGIKAINVNAPQDNNKIVLPYIGVMHFIRDAFLDIHKHILNKTFMIYTLTGMNDISLLLESLRAKKNDLIQHPLEKELAADIGKQISLQKVMIQTKGSGHFYNYAWEIYIKFMFKKTAWELHVTDVSIKQGIPEFKQIDFNEYRKEYEHTLLDELNKKKYLGSESVSEILKIKQHKQAVIKEIEKRGRQNKEN